MRLKTRVMITTARWLLARLPSGDLAGTGGEGVLWIHPQTVRPRLRHWPRNAVIEGWPDGTVAGYLHISFGPTEAEAKDNLIISVVMTRPMLDQLADSMVAVRDLQARQVDALAEMERRGREDGQAHRET